SRKMREVLISQLLREKMIAHCARQDNKFSWEASAAIAMEKFNQILSRQPAHTILSGQAYELAMRKNYEKLIERIGALAAEFDSVCEEDLRAVARCIDRNQVEARRVSRRVRLPQQSRWYVAADRLHECELDVGDLAGRGVDGGLVQALNGIGQRIAVHAEEADVVLSSVLSIEAAQPNQAQITHGLTLEQSAVPDACISALNQNARGVVVQSRFSRKLLIDAGVYIPIAVSADGLDEWMYAPVKDLASPTEKKYRFICDISDVKQDGLDVLLDAYGQVFTISDEVSLLILAERQALRDAQACVDAWRVDCPSRAEVVLLPVTDHPMRKAMLSQSHCFVAPYRFMDAGFPVARAVAQGLPVLTTDWGGQTEQTLPAMTRLIDYRFARAIYPATAFNAYWVEPDRKHLAGLLHTQYTGDVQGSSPRQVVPWRTWSESVSELNRLARVWSSGPIVRPPRIGWITTWNTRCGIASYSEHLTECMSDDIMIFAPRQVERLSLDADHVVRCWDHADTELKALSAEIEHRAIDTLVVQFNYGFFHFPALADFLKLQATRRVKIVVVLHSTTDPAHAPERRLAALVPVLQLCHRILVHGVGDLNRLKAIGLIENVTLFPLGVKKIAPPLNLVAPKDARMPLNEAQENCKEDFLVASYGFFLPHKGLLELIEAVGLLRARGHQVSLSMVNAQYPITESQQLVQQAHAKVEALGLTPYVRVMTDYLAEEESVALLQQADLVVYPYQETGESASAAVRFGLAAMRPVAVTPLAIFDDVDVAVFRLPGFTPEALASGIQTLRDHLLAQDSDTLDKLETAKAWCQAHQYPKLAIRLAGILKAEQDRSKQY
ncbi:glycosyltransferase, partial [Zwartia sp.]|uniref:glycosyltransferase n=1 Tax=Zwartia sp. TaxID=2978004 RepID=UPI002717F0F5